jgi:nicotinate phosphoribosyltransferase
VSQLTICIGARLHLRGGSYSTVAGIEEAVDFLKNFKFTDDDIAYLAAQTRPIKPTTSRAEKLKFKSTSEVDDFLTKCGVQKNDIPGLKELNADGLRFSGVDEVIAFFNNHKNPYSKYEFTSDKAAQLRNSIIYDQKPLFTPEFLNFLKETPMKLDVEALPEGEVQTTPGPVMRIKGPLYQCQLVESALLNILNRNSIIATRASQLHEVADGSPVADFGLRRAASLDVGGARAAYIGGCSATADTDAGRRLGIPTSGTMAHAWIMNSQEEGKPNVETELVAFKAFLKSMPHNSVLLVDTYNPYQGIDNAIKAAIEMNTPLDGMRLDSGNLVDLAWYASKQIEAAQKDHPELFANSKVFMTDGLDEQKILKLRKELDVISQKEDGKPFPKILSYGVGTELQNPGPFRGGVYKVSAHESDHGMEPAMKLAGINSENPELPASKASIPGVDLDIMRLWKNGKIVADIIVDKARGTEGVLAGGKAISLDDNKTEVTLPAHDKAETLLKPIFKRNAQGVSEYVFDEPEKKTLYNGRQVTDLAKIREFHLSRKAALPENVRRIDPTEKPVVLIDQEIQKLRLNIIAKTNEELAAKPGNTTKGDLQAHGGRNQQQQI